MKGSLNQGAVNFPNDPKMFIGIGAAQARGTF